MGASPATAAAFPGSSMVAAVAVEFCPPVIEVPVAQHSAPGWCHTQKHGGDCHGLCMWTLRRWFCTHRGTWTPAWASRHICPDVLTQRGFLVQDAIRARVAVHTCGIERCWHPRVLRYTSEVPRPPRVAPGEGPPLSPNSRISNSMPGGFELFRGGAAREKRRNVARGQFFGRTTCSSRREPARGGGRKLSKPGRAEGSGLDSGFWTKWLTKFVQPTQKWLQFPVHFRPRMSIPVDGTLLSWQAFLNRHKPDVATRPRARFHTAGVETCGLPYCVQ